MIALETSSTEPSIETTSTAMQPVVRILAAIASHDVPVLLRGEEGSGKSGLARALHAASQRRERPSISIDCQALEGEGLAAAQVLVARRVPRSFSRRSERSPQDRDDTVMAPTRVRFRAPEVRRRHRSAKTQG